MKGLTILLASLLLACTARAQGYFTFPEIPGVGETPAVQIDLNQQMLNFLISVTESGGEEEAAQVLAGLEGIRVRVYKDLPDPDAVLDFVDDTSGDLERDGWQRAVFIQEGDERVRMYIQFDEDRVTGMTVMIVDSGRDNRGRDDGSEAVFINVAGVIDPVVLGRLSRQMGIDGVMEGVGGAFVPGVSAAGRGGSAGTDDGSDSAADSD